jgi:histidine phosphotransferase ChpT
MQIDLRVLEILSSKLCHDLVSPISAINNGVELIDDIGGGVVDEAMKLIGDSATHASRRLRLFRMAYGRAGSDDGINVKEAKQIAEQYMTGGKITLSWADDQPSAALTPQKGYLKTILNMVLLSEEVLAYGGVITLRSVTEDNTEGCRFEIVGRNAQLSEKVQAALEGTTPIEDITPRSIQAYMTGKFATHFGLGLKFDQSVTDRLDLSLFSAEVLSPALGIASSF